MSDEHMDDLLRDLNRALSVEPSPSVAAKVRIRIGEGRASRTGWIGWATVAAMALVAVAYLSVPRELEQPERTASPPEAPSDVRGVSLPLTDPLIAPETAEPAPDAGTTRRAATSAVALSATREPGVLVPSSARVAYEALRRQIAEGRITGESFMPARDFEGPKIVGPTVLELAPFEIETVRIGSDPSEPTDSIPSSMLDETRSHS